MTANLPIAKRWFSRTGLGDGITWLTEPHAHRLLRYNLWHVPGRDRDLLVDTGLGIASLRGEIADLLDHPLVTVATHVHYDHTGSLHEESSVPSQKSCAHLGVDTRRRRTTEGIRRYFEGVQRRQRRWSGAQMCA
jgi:glyoxylase-like metal-dependent hydrolase (beta-lactamase superfamily II)